MHLIAAAVDQLLECVSVRNPLRGDNADLRQMAAQGVERRRALPTMSSRARWRISAAWFSTERTGTKRWPGRPAASQIAAASAASFLLRRT